MDTPSHGDSLLTALVAGCSSAAFAAFVTFPLDFIKTMHQLDNTPQLNKFNAPGFQPGSIVQIMKGSSALVTGNVLKNFTRLLSYNWASNFMAIDSRHDDSKKTSAPRVVIAGAMSATMETVLIIPTERVKITMIQNQILANEKALFPDKSVDITGVDKHHKLVQSIFSRQYVSPHAYFTSSLVSQLKSGKTGQKFLSTHHVKPSVADALRLEFNKTLALTLTGTIRQMYAIHGMRGFFTGSFITFARQVGSSAAWFSTYNATRQLVDPHKKPDEQNWFRFQHSAWQLIGLHFISAAAVIALTQPLDVVKTNIQSKNGSMLFKDSLSTAYKLVLRKGFKCLFSGAVPRGIKIGINGSITAFFYGWIDGGINTLATKTVFTD